ncbi:uncharacterized protein LOC144366667 [Ictidomys tridecemlineatus]
MAEVQVIMKTQALTKAVAVATETRRHTRKTLEESCRLNILSPPAAIAAAAAAAAAAQASSSGSSKGCVDLPLQAAVPSLLTDSRVLAHSALASLPCSLAVTHNYSGSAAECR